MHACEIAAPARDRHGARAASRRRAVGARHARRRRHARLLGQRADAGGSADRARDLEARRAAARRPRRRAISRREGFTAPAPGASSGCSTCATPASRTRSRCRCRRATAPTSIVVTRASTATPIRQRPAEVVAVRVRAAGDHRQARAAVHTRAASPAPARPVAMRPGRFGGRMVPTAFYRWDDLVSPARAPPVRRSSPAAKPRSSCRPAARFSVDGYGNVVIMRPRH